jgi:hypothetical protein
MVHFGVSESLADYFDEAVQLSVILAETIPECF